MPKQIRHSLLRTIGDTLKQARAAKGLTQRDLGQRVGLPQSHVSKIEQGGVDLQLSSLAELARALGLELKLIPRQALPAVDGLIAASAADGTEPSTRRARDALAGQEPLARALAVRYPALDEAVRFQEMLRALQPLRFDQAAFKALTSALAPAAKVAELLEDDRDAGQLAAALGRVTSGLRQIRNAQVHGPSTASPRQTPAHSLGDDEDD